MNGLCQQCQVYYPMPEDFSRGVPYACPQCQTLLVPYGEAAPAPAEVGTAAGTVQLSAPAGPDAPDDITLVGRIPDALRPPAPAPPPADPGSRVRVVWFHPHPSPEVAAARAELAAEEPKTPAGAVSPLPPPGAAGPGTPAGSAGAGADGARPGVGSAPVNGSGAAVAGEKQTTFVLRGAGEGVSREELPLDMPKRAPAPPVAAEPPPRRTQEPVPRFRQITTAASPVRRRGAAVVWAVVGVLLLGGAGAAWYLTGPGAATWRRLVGDPARPATPAPAKTPAPSAPSPPARPVPSAPPPPATQAPAPGSAAASPTAPAPAKAAPSPTAPAPAKAAPSRARSAALRHRSGSSRPPAKAAAPKPAAPRHSAPRAAAPRHPASRAAAPRHPAPRAAAPRHPASKPAGAASHRPAGAAGTARAHAEAPRPPPAADADPAPEADAMTQVRRGNLLFSQGKIDQAIAAYRAAVKLDPRSGLAHRGLGVAYAKLGRAAAAAKEYQRYLDLAPSAPDAPQVRRIIKAYYDQTGRAPASAGSRLGP